MITINDIVSKKGKEKITMVTAYDYQCAKIVDEAKRTAANKIKLDNL